MDAYSETYPIALTILRVGKGPSHGRLDLNTTYVELRRSFSKRETVQGLHVVRRDFFLTKFVSAAQSSFRSVVQGWGSLRGKGMEKINLRDMALQQ